MDELELLRGRVTNLEIALQGLWAMLADLQPPDTQRDIAGLMTQHFEASSKLGGFGG